MPFENVTILEHIPGLAWIVRVRNGAAAVYCGSGIVVSERGLFEGCWDGEFDCFDFHHSANVFGSGVRLDGAAIRFVPPTHTLEALYVCVRRDTFLVSNSLAFLAEFDGLHLPFGRYRERLSSVVYGLDRYNRLLLDGSEYRLYRICFEAFEIQNREPATFMPASPPDFGDYTSYCGYLTGVLQAVFRNGADSARRYRLTPITTCSSGYDSAASAALATRLGCREALTLTTARGGAGDSGARLVLV